MSTDPDQIRREIEATRHNLSSDVDALAYKVSPSRIVDDRKRRARDTAHHVRDRIMGTASDLRHSTTSGVNGAASSAGYAAQRAPRALREKSEGNPLAAGLVAFGVGWLASSLLPTSRREQQVASQVKEQVREHSHAVTEKVGEVAGELKEQLREPAERARSSVAATAQDAVHAVRDDSTTAAQDVRAQARQARDNVRH